MTRPIETLLIAEWLVTLIAALAFIVLYGWPSKYRERTMSWHISSVTAVAAAESAGLLAIILQLQISLWLYVAIYGAGAAVVVWRLILLIKAKRRDRDGR